VSEDGLIITKHVSKTSEKEYKLCGDWWKNFLPELQYRNNRDKMKDGKLQKQDSKERKKVESQK
jgi:hypothetical protein